jgi:transposase InsO family protein
MLFVVAAVKRYGCVFTCLFCRAVHIEVLETLEADSFINGFRRFIARRGMPAKVICDNGTNFVAAEAELRDVWRRHSDALGAFATSKGIEWRFNPPSAPHMGGAWERLIGVVKRVLRVMLPSGTRLMSI